MKKFITAAVCLALGTAMILDAKGITACAAESLRVCLEVIIPSLFAPMALSAFLTKSGICGVEPLIFALSLVGGYPVGAVLLAEKVRENPGYAERAARMLAYCYCGSPVFIIALSGEFGIYIWLSNALACVLFALASNIRAENAGIVFGGEYRVNSKTLIESVTSSGKALYQVCLMIVLFGVIIRIAEFAGITGGYFKAFAEISFLTKIAPPIPLAAFITSFGGFCVLLQTAMICGGKVSLRNFFAARIPIALLSAGICKLIMPSGKAAVTAFAAEKQAALSSGNAVSSVCLLIMTGILLFENNCFNQ